MTRGQTLQLLEVLTRQSEELDVNLLMQEWLR